jgi:hypothetical protein
MRGPEVGRLTIQCSGAERNLSLLYHIRFSSHVPKVKPGPISIRAGEQLIELSAKPASSSFERSIGRWSLERCL